MAKTISITKARKDIYKIAEEVCEVHEEALIYNASTGKNVVMISEEDWNAIKETLYISGVPGLAESIKQAAAEPVASGTEYIPGEEW